MRLLLILACSLAWPSVAWADPPPACPPGVEAGRIDLDAGQPASVDCACYDADAEACLIARYGLCRADLLAAGVDAAEVLANCETAREALQQALSDAALSIKQAAADLRAAAPPWWDRAWVGSAAAAVGLAAIAAGFCALDPDCHLLPWRDR